MRPSSYLVGVVSLGVLVAACGAPPEHAALTPVRTVPVDTLSDAELAALPARVSPAWARGLARQTVRFALGDTTLPCGTLAGLVRAEATGAAVPGAELYRLAELLPAARTDARGEFSVPLAGMDGHRRAAWSADAAGLVRRSSQPRALRSDAAYWVEFRLAPTTSPTLEREYLYVGRMATRDAGAVTIVELAQCRRPARAA